MGKTDIWNKTRAKLKKRFFRAGITTCELRYGGCKVTNFLSFAHRMKRRKITTQEELETVILCCVPCHEIIERKSAEEMFDITTEVINGRKNSDANLVP